MYDKLENISCFNNIITIENCNHPKCASDFMKAIKDVLYRGYEEIVLKSNARAYFPNACVPIAGIISFYQNEGIIFKFDIQEDDYWYKCGISQPYQKSAEEIAAENFPFDKIYLYDNSAQVANLTQAYIDAISHQSLCEIGVINGLTWCINEVMDNVLVHSEISHGFVMAQYHPRLNHIAFCIYDYGTGIYNTMRTSSHKPRTEMDSISLAIQEGVGDGKGQGNGLFGLFETVQANGGSLTITSGASSLMLLYDGTQRKFEHVPFLEKNHRGTIVDFQLDLNKPIDIKKIFKSIGGFDGFDIRIDNMIDDNDSLVYDILEHGQGTATREAGRYIRVDVENILRRNPTKIILDFKNVKTVSSSFIDELVAKLFLNLGFVSFNTLIQITNMSEDIKYLCERSLYMRISEHWNEVVQSRQFGNR